MSVYGLKPLMSKGSFELVDSFADPLVIATFFDDHRRKQNPDQNCFYKLQHVRQFVKSPRNTGGLRWEVELVSPVVCKNSRNMHRNRT